MYWANADVRVVDLPDPHAGPGEAVLRITASGLCGSDVMEWYRKDKVPLVLGHEVAGEIVEVGPPIDGTHFGQGVTRLKVGDRVVASHHVPCGACHYCRTGHETACPTLYATTFDPGGFCEKVRLPPINVDRGVYKIPGGVSDEEATFAEPLACVLRGQRRLHLEPGNSLFVIGSGISGILHIALARALGAGRIVASDPLPFRRESAQRFGADAAFDAKDDLPARLREINDGRLADRVICTAGALPAIAQALACVERGGSVLFFAPTDPGKTVPLSINDVFWKKDVTLTTSYAGSPADHVAALELIRGGTLRVREMITHRFPLAEAQEAFLTVAQARDSIKVIVRPQE
jgi:L-iditol 2-dehydrogenase